MITSEQRETRKSSIGSSDAAAIVGVDEYRNASDVWLEKTGQADGFEGNEHTERGNFLEPVLVNWLRQKHGLKCITDVMRVTDDGLLCANFDGINGTDNFTVEAKTATNSDEWGDEDSDNIPERHIVQVHHGMYVAGPEYRLAYVPVLLPGYRSLDFRLYRVKRNDDLANAIAERCRHFMSHNVKLGIKPDDFRPSLEVLKRVRRQFNKSVEIADALIERWIVTKAAKKQAEDDAEAAQAAVIAALGDAEQGTFAAGTVTYFNQLQKRIDTERVRSEFPDVAVVCEKELSFRVLRMPKASKGKRS